MSSVRGGKDGARSIRSRATDSSTGAAGDWLAPATPEPTPSGPTPSGLTPRDPHALGRRSATERRAGELPRWLRALFFLPAQPRMAHRDAHLAETGHDMARPPLSAQAPLSAQGDVSPIVAPGAIADRYGHGPVFIAGPGGPGGSGGSGGSGGRPPNRRPHRDQRRREVGAVLGLLLVASAFSVAAPITGLGTEPEPTPIYVILDDPGNPAAAIDSLEPTDSPTPEPSPSASASASASASTTPQPTPKPTARPVVRTFAALGDSLTAWPTANPWPSRLDAQDNLLTLVANAGVPGNTTSQMRSRLASDVYPAKPKVLFVLGGTNDLGYGISESAIIANLRAIIVDAKAHKIMVILINVPPDSYTNMVPKIKSLNAAILHLGNSQKVNVIDIYGVLANGDGVYQPRYTSDGLHFSDLGCQTVANTIRTRIKRLGL